MGDALHTHGGVVSAQEARLADAGLLAVQGPTPLDVRTGVLHGPGTTALVTGTNSTAPMRYAVAPHQWVTSRGAANGPYRGSLDAVQLVNTTAAPGSGSRVDLIYEKQADSTPGVPTPDDTTEPVYGVVQGTATTGTPAKPALPVGAIELATAVVTAGNTRTDQAAISNTARQTSARGAPVPVQSEAERDALATYPGLHVTRLDLGGVIQRWITGTTWRSYLDESDRTAVTSGTLTLNSLYRAASYNTVSTPRWRRTGQEMSLQGAITNVSTPFTAGTGTFYPLGTLPAGTAPAEDQVFSAAYATGSAFGGAWLAVRASGAVEYLVLTQAGPGFILSLADAHWRVGA